MAKVNVMAEVGNPQSVYVEMVAWVGMKRLQQIQNHFAGNFSHPLTKGTRYF